MHDFSTSTILWIDGIFQTQTNTLRTEKHTDGRNGAFHSLCVQWYAVAHCIRCKVAVHSAECSSMNRSRMQNPYGVDIATPATQGIVYLTITPPKKKPQKKHVPRREHLRISDTGLNPFLKRWVGSRAKQQVPVGAHKVATGLQGVEQKKSTLLSPKDKRPIQPLKCTDSCTRACSPTLHPYCACRLVGC